MRFSIWPSLTQPWADVLAVAKHAEATGWDGVYVADHFMGDAGGPWPVEIPTLEATAVLAALAAATERVRLSPLVFGITYRHPAVLAKWAATVDHVSGGRLLLGVGAGWQENEHEQYGIPLGSPGERIERFEEARADPAAACCPTNARRSRAASTRCATRWPSRSRCRSGCRSSSAARATACSASSPGMPTSGTCGRTRRAVRRAVGRARSALRASRARSGDDPSARPRRCSR